MDKDLTTEVIDTHLVKSERVEKVKPVIVFAKKEKKKYNFNKNTYNNTYYNKTVNNDNSFIKPELNEGDGFILSVFKLFSTMITLSFFLIIKFFKSFFSGNKINMSKKSREIRKKKKIYNKLREV